MSLLVSGQRQQTALVAPQELKRFHVETRPFQLWHHRILAEKGQLCGTKANANGVLLRVQTEVGGFEKAKLGKRFGAKREEVTGKWKRR